MIKINEINNIRLIKRPEVEKITGLSRSSIYALMKQKKFPRQIKISERSAAWLYTEVIQFVESRIAASREGGAI